MAASTKPPGQAGASIVSSVAAPAGTEALAVEWVRVSGPAIGDILAAVPRPLWCGPVSFRAPTAWQPRFRTTVCAIGGRSRPPRPARGRSVLVFGRRRTRAQFVTPPIACPDAPAMTDPGSSEAVRTVATLVSAARSLPGALPDRVGLFGHSRGSAAALTYIMGASDASVRAAVLENGGYPKEWVARADQMTALKND